MNPLNRKMFRQPGMSRQPMGILASSPELANVVRRRMGQPVQMVHGGYHPPRSPMGRLTTSRRPVPGDVRIPVIDALPKSGFARPALDRFLASTDNIPSSGIAAIRGRATQDALTDLAMQSIKRGGTPFGDSMTARSSAARPDVVKRGQDLAQISSADRSENTGNSFSGIMAMIRDAIPDARGYASSPAAAKSQFTKSFLGPALQATPQELSASLQDDPDMNVIRDQIEIASSSLPDDDLMVSEQLAAGKKSTDDGSGAKTTDATGRQVSTVNPKTTTAIQKLNDNFANIKGDVFNPEDQKDLTADEATNPKVVEEFTFKTADLIDPKSVDLEAIDKAAKDAMGFDPKAAGKKKEEAFWMGLMKAGLAIAAGGSQNAMTNIAKGLSYGLDSYSKDIATLNEQERADRKEFRQLKTQMIRDERSYNLTIAGIKNTYEQSKVAAENQFQKNKIDIGFKRADAIRQNKRIANEQAYREATLEADTLYKIRSIQQGDEKIQISKEALESKSFKTFRDAKIVDEKGEPTALGLEIYGTPQGVAKAMIDNDLRTGSKKVGPQVQSRSRYILDALGDTDQLDTARDAIEAATGSKNPTTNQLEAYFGSQYDRVTEGVTAAPAPAPNTYTDETLKEATAQGLVWSPNTRAANGKMGAFVKGTN